MDNVMYFAYGANLCLAHMALWCPEAMPVGRASLPGHRLVFRTWVDAAPSPDDAVPGALYELGPRDLGGLDEFQDFPALYGRTRMSVVTDRGPVTALVYRMAPGRTLALPDEDYLNLLLQGYADWDLAPGVLAALGKV
jgi:gamma-glutamylcyclotransferase (GGCT)/AIG2-like uncharacterized protein YtfP